jgi:peptide/nickel transport system ATP-binding protein
VTTEQETPFLELKDVVLEYRDGRFRPRHRVLDGVSFTVMRGETVAIVGESGSGKTTIAKAILGLARVASGAILLNGRDITAWSAKQRKALVMDLQIVYQDPYRSLSPTRRIEQTLAEPVLAQGRVSREAMAEQSATMLELVGLRTDSGLKYPSQFSGGERQRIAIARALMLSPHLVICDEPLSSLDVSIQGQVLNLLADLKSSHNPSYLFISHNIPVVRYFADKVVVLRNGEIVESGDAETVCGSPQHEYTKTLIDAVPDFDPDVQDARRQRRHEKTSLVRAASTAEVSN